MSSTIRAIAIKDKASVIEMIKVFYSSQALPVSHPAPPQKEPMTNVSLTLFLIYLFPFIDSSHCDILRYCDP